MQEPGMSWNNLTPGEKATHSNDACRPEFNLMLVNMSLYSYILKLDYTCIGHAMNVHAFVYNHTIASNTIKRIADLLCGR
jgi:hypothetical protein